MSGGRSKRILFNDKHLCNPTDFTTKVTQRKPLKIHNGVLRKNYDYLRNMGETQTKEKVYQIKKQKCRETCKTKEKSL